MDERTPLEIYMEGNVVFRQGERVIYADRMYYNVPNKTGTILNAEMLTPGRQITRAVAGEIRYVPANRPRLRYYAKNTLVTSSRMGEPGYSLQAGDIFFEDIQSPMIDPMTGQTCDRFRRPARQKSSISDWPPRRTILSSSGRCRCFTGRFCRLI